jgi:hypothetical protein
LRSTAERQTAAAPYARSTLAVKSLIELYIWTSDAGGAVTFGRSLVGVMFAISSTDTPFNDRSRGELARQTLLVDPDLQRCVRDRDVGGIQALLELRVRGVEQTGQVDVRAVLRRLDTVDGVCAVIGHCADT